MSKTVTPYKISNDSKKVQVATMFNNIAPKYDFLNHLLSGGIDIWWRKKAINLLKQSQPKIILDIATGTGDFATQALTLNPDKIIGIDISEGMLEFGRKKLLQKKLSDRIELQTGDAENIQFADAFFDAAIVAFGVRNFENLEKGLKEIARVIKPGGTFVVLEFSKPRKFPVKQFYGFYSRFILPFVGKVFSKDQSAYDYLPESVKAFPCGNDFLKIMMNCGFKEASAKSLTFGVVTIYTAKK